MLKKTHDEIIESHRLYPRGSRLLCDISPCDEFQYWYKCFTHTRKSYVHSTFQDDIRIIEQYCSDFEYCMETSKEGRIHYHMNMTVEQPAELVGYVGYMRRAYASQIKIDTIKDEELRKRYLKKDGPDTLLYYKKDRKGPTDSIPLIVFKQIEKDKLEKKNRPVRKRKPRKKL